MWQKKSSVCSRPTPGHQPRKFSGLCGQLPRKGGSLLFSPLTVCNRVYVQYGEFPWETPGILETVVLPSCVCRGHSAALLGVREVGRRVGETRSAGMRVFAKIKMFPIAVST